MRFKATSRGRGDCGPGRPPSRRGRRGGRGRRRAVGQQGQG